MYEKIYISFSFSLNGFIWSSHHLHLINIIEKTINTTTVSYDFGLMPLRLIVLVTHPKQHIKTLEEVFQSWDGASLLGIGARFTNLKIQLS